MLRDTSALILVPLSVVLSLGACVDPPPRAELAIADESAELEPGDRATRARVQTACSTCSVDPSSCPSVAGSPPCSETCPCSAGYGDCDSDLECLAGLVCGKRKGSSFGLPYARDACVLPHCTNSLLEPELGEGPGLDCGGECGMCANLALQRPATQSSMYLDYGADRAVDGNTDGDFENGSVAHTLSQYRTWWQVDLGSRKTITEIRVWNRTDCCAERLTNWWVFVTTSDPGADPDPVSLARASITRFVAFIPDSPAPLATISVPARAGRYVRIVHENDWMHLAEVEVFGR